MNVGIIGLGFVGGAIEKSFRLKKINVLGYDKYKDGGIESIEDLLDTKFVFLCLPTLFNEELKTYNKKALNEVCLYLEENKYTGLVVIKSTIEPETTNKLSSIYSSLKLCHNPEFLTARTAFEDFHNQKHIVLGKGTNCKEEDITNLSNFYSQYYPESKISICTSLESESMKIFCNSFYASKIMLFNEYYLLCEKNGSDFNKIRDLMLKNEWIHSMHTQVPGTDGKKGYGGACFPKDTQALLEYTKIMHTPNNILQSVVNENNEIRNMDK